MVETNLPVIILKDVVLLPYNELRIEFATDKDKLILIDDLNDVIKKVKEESLGDIYTMVCFDMTEIIRKKIKEHSNGEN